MTDRRRQNVRYRVWRATAGRFWPLIRRHREVWAWWTERGVIPRWQLLLVYMLVVGAFAWNSSETRDVARKAKTDATVNKIALCALRVDLEKRVANSQQFLREHPRGIAGISPKVIRDGITNQQRTIKALSVVSCPP